MRTALRLLLFLRPLAGWVGLATLLAAATIGANIGLLGTSADLIARAALHPSVAELQVAIVGVRFFGIVRSLLRYLERLASHSANFRLLAELRSWFYRKLEPLAPAGLIEKRGGDLLNRVVGDIDGLEDFYVRAVAPPAAALVVTLALGLGLGFSYPQLGAILAGGMVINGLGVPWLAGRLGQAPGKGQVQARAQLSADLVDGLQGMADLLASSQEAGQMTKMRIASEALGQAQASMAVRGGLVNAFNGLLANLTLWAMLLAAIPLVRAGGMEGVFLAVVSLVTLAAFEAVQPLGPASQRLEAALQSAGRLFEVADAPPEVTEPPGKSPELARGGLRIKNLGFSYQAGLPPALEGFDLELPAGKWVGLVGPSGAGKSTLFGVLTRFWEPQQGQIWLAGEPLEAYCGEDARRAFTVLGQATTIFSGTLRSNLRLARPEASEEEMEDVLRRARLWEWVQNLPEGLGTRTGERGLQLSGGEQQRLAIARALLQDRPIWLLDELTAHLDGENRRAVREVVLEAARGRSLIWITHELDELEQMDELIVLQAGRVVERGRPEQLAAASGWYGRWLKNCAREIFD